MAIGNGKLMQECFLKHSRMGTARMKSDKETEEEGKKRRENGKKQRGYERKRSPYGLSLHNQNTILLNIIKSYFIRYRKIQ